MEMPYQDSIVVVAVYGTQFIFDQYLPDKAIDLVDEAASTLWFAWGSGPSELGALNCQDGDWAGEPEGRDWHVQRWEEGKDRKGLKERKETVDGLTTV